MNGAEENVHFRFRRDCAQGIVDLLCSVQSGRDGPPGELKCPEDLEIPPGVEQKIPVRENWTYVALHYWAWTQLSDAQQRVLKDGPFDADTLGNQFLVFLCYMGTAERPKQPPLKYILNHQNPVALLGTWFGRFLMDSRFSPFQRNPVYKLHQRFEAILGSSAEFVCDQLAWRLREQRADVTSRYEKKLLAGFLIDTLGAIKPLLYKSDPSPANRDDEDAPVLSRADPLLRQQDAIRIARSALSHCGPMSTFQLAEVTHEIMEPKPWVTAISSIEDLPPGSEAKHQHQEWREVSHGEYLDSLAGSDVPDTEGSAPALLGHVEAAGVSDSLDLAAGSGGDLAQRATLAWQGLGQKHRVIAAARLFLDEPWSFQQIEDWTERNLGARGRIRISMAQYYAGKKDARIEQVLLNQIPADIRADRAATQKFLEILIKIGRKLLGVPPLLEEEQVDSYPQEP